MAASMLGALGVGAGAGFAAPSGASPMVGGAGVGSSAAGDEAAPASFAACMAQLNPPQPDDAAATAATPAAAADTPALPTSCAAEPAGDASTPASATPAAQDGAAALKLLEAAGQPGSMPAAASAKGAQPADEALPAAERAAGAATPGNSPGNRPGTKAAATQGLSSQMQQLLADAQSLLQAWPLQPGAGRARLETGNAASGLLTSPTSATSDDGADEGADLALGTDATALLAAAEPLPIPSAPTTPAGGGAASPATDAAQAEGPDAVTLATLRTARRATPGLLAAEAADAQPWTASASAAALPASPADAAPRELRQDARTGDAKPAVSTSASANPADASGAAAATLALPSGWTRAAQADAASTRQATAGAAAVDGIGSEARSTSGTSGTAPESGLAAGAAMAAQQAASTPAAGDAQAFAGRLRSAFEAQLSTPVGSPHFGPALGLQVSTLVKNGVPEARLHLNPAELGPIAVQLALQGQVAQVHLAADHALTRQALEQAMPQLASALQDAGFTLGGGGVSQQSAQQSAQQMAQQQGREPSQGQAGSWRLQGRDAGQDAEPLAVDALAARSLRRSALGGVDLYA